MPSESASGTVSVVLRLSSVALAEGRLVGDAELVITGSRAIVRGERELLEFVQHAAGPSGG